MGLNIPGTGNGFVTSQKDGTTGLCVGGYLQEYWHGQTRAHVTLPPYCAGELGWDNMSEPDVYVADATLLHPHGTRLQIGQRVFYYATYYGAITSWAQADTAGDDLLGKGLQTFAFAQDYADKLTGAADSTSIALADTVAGTPTERVDNFYSGGWLNVKDTAPSDARMISRFIVSSTMDATTATTTNLVVDKPLPYVITGGNSVLMPNPYKFASWHYDHSSYIYSRWLGVCMVNNPTAAYGIWLQTYGPCGMNHVANANEGAGDGESIVLGMGDGAIQVLDGNTDTYSYSGHRPIIGYTMPNSRTESGSGQDEGYPIVFLTINS